jgi:hypothetical protein
VRISLLFFGGRADSQDRVDPIRSLADQGKDQVNERAAAILAPVALTRRPGAREGAGAGPAGMGDVAFSRRRLISYGTR